MYVLPYRLCAPGLLAPVVGHVGADSGGPRLLLRPAAHGHHHSAVPLNCLLETLHIKVYHFVI